MLLRLVALQAAALPQQAASALPPVTPGASLSPPEGDLAEQVLSEGRARLEEWRTFVAKQKLEASRTATRWYDQSSCDGEDRTHFLGIFGAAAQCAPAAVEQGCELFMFSEAYTSWGCYGRDERNEKRILGVGTSVCGRFPRASRRRGRRACDAL